MSQVLDKNINLEFVISVNHPFGILNVQYHSWKYESKKNMPHYCIVGVD